MNSCEMMKDAIKREIERVFGEINDFGCYCSETGEWLSTEHIFEVVCNVIDDNDWLFAEDD